ncbi:unnamed protein product [Linum trigynum]|uniref:Uncharacterized protein n=1 Tax=Linum trigynum TaxID=586398 RepID=A0AAV2E6G8_9ROSI
MTTARGRGFAASRIRKPSTPSPPSPISLLARGFAALEIEKHQNRASLLSFYFYQLNSSALAAINVLAGAISLEGISDFAFPPPPSNAATHIRVFKLVNLPIKAATYLGSILIFPDYFPQSYLQTSIMNMASQKAFFYFRLNHQNHVAIWTGSPVLDTLCFSLNRNPDSRGHFRSDLELFSLVLLFNAFGFRGVH